MKVLMATPSYYPVTGGVETVINSLCTNLYSLGIQTDVLTFNMDQKWHPKWFYDNLEDNTKNIIRIPGLNWFPAEHSDRFTMGINLLPASFTKFIKNYDILHFHVGDLTFPFFTLLHKMPKVVQCHGPLNLYKKNFISRMVLKHSANCFIAISHKMFSEFLEIGVPQSKIEYVPNSVNTQLFFPINKTYENKVLFVGRLNFNKGLHVLLKSLNYITVNLELTVVGPSDSNLTYFKELMNEITRQNVLGKHRINYVGPKNQEELIRLYQDASIFVLPSFREASPMSILEAMACGTPVVATPVGGIPEMVNDNTTGLIIPTGDPVKLGHAIETLLNNPELRIKFGKNARKRVMTLFSDEKIMEKYRTIYESILKN